MSIINYETLEGKKLLVIVPCRERPKVLKSFINSFEKTASRDTQVIFCLDDDDPELSHYKYHIKNYPHIVGKRKTITKIFNEVALELCPGFEFYMPCNDDFIFRTRGWDITLMKIINDRGGWGIAYGNDKIQGQNLCTTSVISGDIVRALGWLQMPDLTHLFGDNVWLTIGQMIERIYYCPDVVIEHNHFINKRVEVDSVYKRTNSQAMYQKDSQVFEAWRKIRYNEADRILKSLYREKWHDKKISLCMIVADYESPERLKKCLASVKDYVDEINIQFNHKQFKRAWRLKRLLSVLPKNPRINWKYERWINFSANRNMSLDMATLDYVLWLDADDVVKTPYLIKDYIYRFPDADYFKVQVHSYTEVKGKEFIYQNRLFKNGKGYKFTNAVHEDISFSMLEKKAVMQSANIEIHHYGNMSIKDLARKNIRNLKLVRADIQKPSAHSLTYFALVNCLVMLGSHSTYDFYCTTNKVFRFFRKPLRWLGIKAWMARKSYAAYQEAVQIVDECFKKFPPNDKDPLTRKMWVLRGLACMQCGQRDAAWQSFNSAYIIDHDPEGAINLAYIYINEKKWQKAVDVLMPVFDKGGFNVGNLPYDVVEMEAILLKDLGICYYNLMLESFNSKMTSDESKKAHEYALQAENFYKRFLSLSPGNLVVIDQLCNVLRNLGKHNDANMLTVQAVNKFPSYAVGWYNLGQTELMQKRFSTAKMFLERAVIADPNHSESKHNLQMLKNMGI